MNGLLMFLTKAPIFALTIATALLNLGILGSVDGLKVLVVSPNFGYSHLEFHGHLADLLVQRGHYVDFQLVRRLNSQAVSADALLEKTLLAWRPRGFLSIHVKASSAPALTAREFKRYFPPKHFLTPEIDPTLKSNGTRLSQKVTRYTPQGEFRHKIKELIAQTPLKKNPFEGNIDFSDNHNVDLMKQMFGGHCFDLVSNKEFLDELRAEKFDIGIAELFDMCSFPLFHVLGIKTTVATSSTPLMANFAAQLGLPSPPYVAEMNSAPVNSSHLSFFQRITNLYETYRSSTIWGPVQEYALEGVRRIHSTIEIPSGVEIMRRTSFIFLNVNEYLEIPRPISSKIKFIGGIALKKPKELSSGIREIIDKAKKGVVIFSFGSLVDTDNMPKSVRDAFVYTFSQFPEYEFIWKMNGLNPNFTANLPENVHTMEWIDQPSLLAHPKTKAFITHCGLNSLNEAAHFGVPLIAIPMFGDQNYNTAIVQNKGIGVALSRIDITRESVSKALGDVLNSPSYSNKMKTLSRKLHRVPFKPAQVFVENVEFAAEFEGDFEELNLPGSDLNFFQYFMLDFFIPAALVSIAVVLMTAKAIFRILWWLREIRSKKID